MSDATCSTPCDRCGLYDCGVEVCECPPETPAQKFLREHAGVTMTAPLSDWYLKVMPPPQEFGWDPRPIIGRAEGEDVD